MGFVAGQRKRDDNKIKFALFRGGLGRGAGRKIVQNATFYGKRHDNKILKVNILLSRNFVVMAQAPSRCVALHNSGESLGKMGGPESRAPRRPRHPQRKPPLGTDRIKARAACLQNEIAPEKYSLTRGKV